MFGSTILEVAIGMTLVYVLLSLICSTLNEWIARVFALRAGFLKNGIANLLNDPVMKDLVGQFYKHPLIDGLSRKNELLPLFNAKPSYISANTFAKVLIDLLPKPQDSADPTQNSAPQTLQEIYNIARATLVANSEKGSTLARKLLILIDSAGVNPQKIEQIKTLAARLEAAHAQLQALMASDKATANPAWARLLSDNIKQMEADLKGAETELTTALQQAQLNVEDYFNEAMARVSGWYKRRVQLILVGLALVVTIVLNVDSIAIANHLMTNPAQRALIVEMAAQQHSDLGLAVTSTLTQTVPITETAAITPTVDSFQLLQDLGLPMGWKKPLAAGQRVADGQEWLWVGWHWWDWAVKLVGLLITVAAASMGASFWFDLLSKLLNLRMTGKKPEDPAQSDA